MNPHLHKPEPPASWRDRLQALKNLPPLLVMVWETSPLLTSAALLSRLLWALVPVGMLWVAKLIVDLVAAAAIAKTGVPEGLWPLVGAEFALAVTGDLLMRAAGLAESLLGDRFTHHIGVRLMRHASTLDLASFEDPVFYDKLERARRQSAARLGMLSQIASLLQTVLSLLSVSVVIISFSWWFIPVLILALLPVFWGETRFAMLAYSLLYRWTPERRELDYLRLLGASVSTAKEVKLFGLGNFLIERTESLFHRYFQENRKLAIQKAVTNAALNILPLAGYYGAYAVILYRTARGDLSLGDLTFLSGAFLRSRTALENVFSTLSNVSEQALFVRDLFQFFDSKPTIEDQIVRLPAPRPIRQGFEFQGVSFAYHNSQKPVLENVSFRLEPEERIALIGENGAGKTTLIKLISRLYDPTAGRILLDGVDLREYSPSNLRKEIGVIFQDYVKYDMLLRENIGVGRIENVQDQARVEAAAAKSLAAAVAAALPNGYDQMLGRRFEGGSDLSMGQWQKIALGRAYMRDAQLLVLDEPTSSLDARAEFEVFQRFADLTRGKMAILISHRFSTVRMADRILVLNGGRIEEEGTHEQLLAKAGRYAELFELQAAGYR
ncbi:MAG TPA: ABC transporter ATP-binding protein [Bryobacteraceae bacterium]|nr:ABC transporter ATP-binding protein [Bryobacteraceae bacterium]